jgi:hypothetical protein
MKQHYSVETSKMSRSFVVGKLNDCCAASFGLAAGLSFGTFARARSDVKKDGPKRADRRRKQVEKESAQRRTLEAYIRELRGTMEGSKGKGTEGHFFTGKRPIKQRWEDYRKSRLDRSLPVVGSIHLFTKLWRAHDEIYSVKASKPSPHAPSPLPSVRPRPLPSALCRPPNAPPPCV